MPTEERYLTAKQAAEALGITRATLYAYTSRGQLHSELVPGEPRERRYHRQDVERLLQRKEARHDPAKEAERGLHWGSPVLASGITLIEGGRFYYRGIDAVQLAATATLEQTAELLWGTEPGEMRTIFSQPSALSALQRKQLRECSKDPVARMQAGMPLAASVDLASHDLRSAAVRKAGARILRVLCTLATGRTSTLPIHRALQSAWATGNGAAGEAIRTALVLCADHELNASAFAARVAASAGASPYDAVSAAIATLKGWKQGGNTERTAALFDEMETSRRAIGVIAGRLRRGERIPGFGHPLYTSGDPRAIALIQVAMARGNQPVQKSIRALTQAARELIQELPNLDFGLAALSRAYNFPAHAPLILFMLGRTVGWIAHAIEQYADGSLIRPRARYTGPAPLSNMPQGKPAPTKQAGKHGE